MKNEKSQTEIAISFKTLDIVYCKADINAYINKEKAFLYKGATTMTSERYICAYQDLRYNEFDKTEMDQMRQRGL